MEPETIIEPATNGAVAPAGAPGEAKLLARYGPPSMQFTGSEDALLERHLAYDKVIDPATATVREMFEAVARSVRDVLATRWLRTKQTYEREKPKRVYYLSMEFLIGRSLANNAMNLLISPLVDRAVRERGLDLVSVLDKEPDAGLGNGGLGRLAACFLESLATLELPSMGYGLRYEFGMFRQSIVNGWQREEADNWMGRTDPWEVHRRADTISVHVNCSFAVQNGTVMTIPNRPSTLEAIPYDRPVVGYGGNTIGTLRLWAAGGAELFDFKEFSHGDFVNALASKLSAESITRVLYPDDSTSEGKALRFLQEYFLVAASLGDLVRRFRRFNDRWEDLPEKVAIQMNDTHPSMAVAELMRILLDDAGLTWDVAWDITVRTLAYTNHTLLPEALERWPVAWFKTVAPRLLEIIYEINERNLERASTMFPGNTQAIANISLIEEGAEKRVRMANLAIVGSHSTNGVAAIHSELLRTVTVKDLAAMFPERFNNKTNGVTPRRWLLLANPALAATITAEIGDGWVTGLSQLERLKPLAADKTFRAEFRAAKHDAKVRFAEWLGRTAGQTIDPQSIFDCQVKRIHEYKRQLLNVLRIVVLYNRLRQNPDRVMFPRTFFFAGKAAPAYQLAKLIIKLINNVAGTVDGDPVVRGRLKVLFLPEYNVTLAERLIPAADVSNQISTAGYEASGTSNMKFMMNGALTVGTRDGATIEMAQEAGEENFFLFGLTAQQVAGSRGWYDPHWHYNNDAEIRGALDLIFSDHFSRFEPGVFAPIRDMLLNSGDFYMHLADLRPYLDAQERLGALYADQEEWTKVAILNVASSGMFSSDRTIAQYAKDIWGVSPCPIP